MGVTSIEWTDLSWAVVNGCRRKSAGCEACYAERLAATRLRHMPQYKGLAVYGKNGPRWTGETRLWTPYLTMPLRRRKPSRIFVADMGDLFYEGVTDIDVAAVWGVMAACPQHTFQILTKRPERMLSWLTEYMPALAMDERGIASAPCEHETVLRAAFDALGGDEGEGRRLASAWDRMRAAQRTRESGAPWPLPNVWLGTSVEDQKTANDRIPSLLQTPAAVRFVSYEPALGPVDFTRISRSNVGRNALRVEPRLWNGLTPRPEQYLDWIIVGGEAGPGARPFDLAWARSTVKQCREAGARAFVKQLGANVRDVNDGRFSGDEDEPHAWPGNTSFEHDPRDGYQGAPVRVRLRHRKGADMEEWPRDVRVREWPEARHA